jgi:hypothetical protein
MRTQILKPGASAAIGLLLTAPALYFILISILKYVFGWPAFFDAVAPTLEAWGANETPGWNINLLILFGPLIALLLNLTAVIEVSWNANPQAVDIYLKFRKQIKNWLIIGLSGVCLLTLFIYAFGENCNC